MSLSLTGSAQAGTLLLDVDLRVEAGETLAVLGPNGAGKTTLLRTLCGLLPLDSGSVVLDDRVLDAPDRRVFVPPEGRSVGVLFQDLLLFSALDVVDNVAFGLRSARVRRREARSQAIGWLELMGLAHRSSAAVGDLSGGEAQRVALARALARRPRVLLLDEPLAALDAEVRNVVRRELREHLRAHEGPCLLVTHDPLDAAVLADRVVVLEDGLVTARGTLADLVAQPRTAWAAELAGTNLIPAVAAGPILTLADGGTISVAEAPGDGRVFVAIRPAAVSVHLRRPEGSPRNVWKGTVTAIEGFGERFRIQVAGPVPLVAEVTTSAVVELGLQNGSPVWLSVKATDAAAYPA